MKTVIAIDHLSKKYGDHSVFQNFSVEFAHGIYGIMGESGKGKTTLLRMIAGLENWDEGRIWKENVKCGMVFQENRLIDFLDPVKNIKMMNPKLTDEFVWQELQKVGIEEEPKNVIGGKHIRMSKAVGTFSGGMKRRVCLLQVLLSDRELLLLDEPFSGLDLETKRKTMEYVLTKSKNRCIIFTTHEEEEIRFLQAGKIEL